MDADALHLAIDHLPVALSMLGACAALLAFVLGRRSVFLYALFTLVFAGLASWPALVSGRRAAVQVGERWYVNRAAIQRHQETAGDANLVVTATALLALVGLGLTLRAPREARPHAALMGVVLLASVCGATAMGWTSWQGSFIVSRNPRLVESPAPVADSAARATKGETNGQPNGSMSHDAMDHSGH